MNKEAMAYGYLVEMEDIEKKAGLLDIAPERNIQNSMLRNLLDSVAKEKNKSVDILSAGRKATGEQISKALSQLYPEEEILSATKRFGKPGIGMKGKAGIAAAIAALLASGYGLNSLVNNSAKREIQPIV